MEQNQDQEYIEREHCLILEHRRSLKITGVTDVIAYDEHIIHQYDRQGIRDTW